MGRGLLLVRSRVSESTLLVRSCVSESTPKESFGIDAVDSFVRFGIHAQRKCLVQLNETSSLGVGLELYERTCWISVWRTNVLNVSVIAIFGRQVRVVRTNVGYSSFIAARCIVEALLLIVFCNHFQLIASCAAPFGPRRAPAGGRSLPVGHSRCKKGVFRGLPGLVGSSKYRKWTQRTEIFLWVDFQSLARRIRRNPPSPGKSKFHDNWVKGS